jgi:short-subunit dehydrogenase
MNPDRVAKIGVRAMWARKAKVVAGAMNAFGALAIRFIPRRLIAGMTASSLNKMVP